MRNKIRILWLSNFQFNEKNINSTGTWLYSMANELLQLGNIELFNITQDFVKRTQKKDSGDIQQWLVPISRLDKSGLPKKFIVKDIQQIVMKIQPNIIHVWGTETYWGLLTARQLIKGRVLLEIQGLKFEIQKYFFSGLSIKDIIECIGPKEVINLRSSIIGQKLSFKKWGLFEKEIIMNHKYISTQSDWVRNHMYELNKDAVIFKTKMLLRNDFTKSDKWTLEECEPFSIFTSFSSLISYKGLHILIKAISLLKKEFPLIQLNIAGNIGSSGFFENGYLKWLKRKIKQLNLDENINWIGSLNSKEIVAYLRKSNVNVIPSFIESYCMALDEALSVGIPTVASFTSAMIELGKHKESVYFFPVGDELMCANAIKFIFINADKTLLMSQNAYNRKSNIKTVNQIDIYNKILEL